MNQKKMFLLCCSLAVTGALLFFSPQTVQGVAGDVQLDLSAGGQIIGTAILAGKVTDSTNASYYLDPAADPSLIVAGSVGIGTTAPGHILEISSSDTSNSFPGTASMKISNPDTGAFGRVKSITFGYGSNVAAGIASVYNNWTAGNAGGDILAFYTKDSAVSANPTEKVRIDKSGNVGIGDTSPNSPLTIKAASTGDQALYQSWRYTAGSDVYALKLKQTVTSGVVRYTFDMINNSTAYNNVLTLDRGNVGIGTTAPSYTLDVTGTGRFTSTANPGLIVGDGTSGYAKIGETGWYDDGTYFSPLGTRSFYVRGTVPISYIYSPSIYLGSTSGTTIYFRANSITGTGTITSGAINGQTISSTANFTGSLTTGGLLSAGAWGAPTSTTVCKNGGTLVICSSSRQFKHDIQPLSTQDQQKMYEQIKDMNLTSYIYNNDPTNQIHYGLIAEDAPEELQYTDTSTSKPFTNLDFYSQWAYTYAGIKVLDKKVNNIEKSLIFTNANDIILTGVSSDTYAVSTPTGTTDTIGAFAEAIIGKIRAGLIETKRLIVDGVDILKKLNELSVKVESQQRQIDELRDLIHSQSEQ